MTNRVRQDLIDDIRAGKVVAVVGAGVALAATGSKSVAGWIGLLRDGIERIEALKRAPHAGWAIRQRAVLEDAAAGRGDLTDLLGVAEQISERLGFPHDGEWLRWLRETVGALTPATQPRLLKAIADLGIPIATTNYDGLLEDATGHPPLSWTRTADIVRCLRREQSGIWHLHGYWQEPETVVLGIRDYARIVATDTAQHLQRVLPTLNGLLYIGCGAGLEDPNFRALRKWMGTVLPGSEHRHIRLARDADVAAVQREHPPEERTVVLGFGASFDDLAPFVEALARDARRTAPGPTPPPPAGPRLWLDETDAGYADPRYASCYIHAPRQDARAGEGLRVRLGASFGHPPDARSPQLCAVEVRVGLPARQRAEAILGNPLPYHCPSNVELLFRGPSDKTPSWSLRVAEPREALTDRNVTTDDAPLFVLPAAMAGDCLRLTMIAFANKHFYQSQVPAPAASSTALTKAKARIIQRLCLREIGEPNATGEIVLCTTENAVEEVAE
jgi:hypothetical protein